MPANMPEEGGKGKPPRHPPGSGSSAAHGEPPPQDGDGSNTGNYEAPAECQLVLARSSFQIAVSFTLVAFYITEVTTLALRGSYYGHTEEKFYKRYTAALIIQAVFNVVFIASAVLYYVFTYGPSLPTTAHSMRLALLSLLGLLVVRILAALVDSVWPVWLQFLIDLFGYSSLFLHLFMLLYSTDHWDEHITETTASASLHLLHRRRPNRPANYAARDHHDDESVKTDALPSSVRRHIDRHSRIASCASRAFVVLFFFHFVFTVFVLLTNIMQGYYASPYDGENGNTTLPESHGQMGNASASAGPCPEGETNPHNTLHEIAATFEKILVGALLEPMLEVIEAWVRNDAYKQGAKHTTSAQEHV